MDTIEDTDMYGLFASITEVSQAKSYKININFDRRMRVWKTQILTGRMNSIKQEHSIEYIHRMMDLLIGDADRLTNAAIRGMEDDKLFYAVEYIDTIMKTEISKYLTEINILKGVENIDTNHNTKRDQ